MFGEAAAAQDSSQQLQFSMAALQGILLRTRGNPQAAYDEMLKNRRAENWWRPSLATYVEDDQTLLGAELRNFVVPPA